MEDNDKPSGLEGRDEKGRFVRGNLFAIGNNGGRPPHYETAQEFSNKLAEYLDYEDFLKKQGQGKGLYTIEGAALYLGFASRQSMYDNMGRNSEFSYTLNRFKLFLTHWNVQKLYWGGTMMGSKFWLTNNGGYTEESTQHQIITDVKASFGNPIQSTQQSGQDSPSDK